VLYVMATIPKIALFIISFSYILMGPVKLLLPKKPEEDEVTDNVMHPPNQL